MQEYEPQPTLQPSEMPLAEPGVKEYTSCPQKVSLGLIEPDSHGDFLLLLFSTMSLDICYASRQSVILTPISRLLEHTPFDFRPFAFS